ncbi:MAG: HAD family hydrolase [Ectobacillus sp.]
MNGKLEAKNDESDTKKQGEVWMRKIIDKCKVIIFDLDGTLYEGTSHFDYYAKQIEETLPVEQRPLFAEDYEKMKRGAHPLTIGKVYDKEYDVILTLDPLSLKAIEVHTWTGQKWRAEKVQSIYSTPIIYDTARMIAVGDGWWLPYAAGAHYGAENMRSAYDKTKIYMSSTDFHLPKTPGLQKALLKLRNEKKLVLITNSDELDVKRLLRGLELHEVFDFVITDALKPIETIKHFQMVISKHGVKAEEVVSIGDNFINEISPALKLGMYAVYITPHPTEFRHHHLMTVPTLANAFDK